MRLHYPLNSNGAEDAGLLPWADGVPSTGVQGSYPGHAIVTDGEAEILAAIDASGQTRNGSDLTQLVQAIARGIYLGQFSGTANALTAALPNSVVFASLLRGTRLTGFVTTTNTAGVTLALSGIGPLTAPATVSAPLLRRNGTALRAGDLPVNLDFEIRWDGNAFRMAGSVASDAALRIPLQADTTIAVDAVNGTDATGSLTSSFKTTQAAANWATRNLDLAGRTLTFACSGGFTGGVAINSAFVGQIDYSSVVFDLGGTATVASADACFATYGPGTYTVQNTGLLTSNGSGPTQGRIIAPWRGGTILYKNVNFGSTGPSGGYGAHVFARGGTAIMGGNVTISGGSTAHFDSDANGEISLAGTGYAINFAGATNYITAFAVAQYGKIYAAGLTFTGTSPTGMRYYIDQFGTISVNGAGANYFPGSAAGSIAGSPPNGAYY